MRLKALSVLSVMALAVITTACEKSSPSRPSDVQAASASAESVTDARTGVTMVAAQPVSPAANAQITYASQPITMTVTNGVTTGTTALTYAFEVASDTGFSNRVYSKDGVAQGTGGRTSLAIDKLPGAKTYYWRVRINSGSASGPNSAVRAFVVGPEVVLGIPVPSSPTQGGTAFAPIALTVNNITRSGPAGQISYRFQISESSSFADLVFDGTATEQGGPGGQTSISVTANLTDGGTYQWRAQALDPTNGLTTTFSGVSTFRAQLFSMQRAVIHHSPSDLGSWPETAKITSLVFTGDAMVLDFDKRDGPDRWPDEPFGSGDIQYSLGMCLNIGGQWHCSAPIQFWHGRELEASGRPDEIALNWFYDGARWGVMAGHQPSFGETIGMFVGAGNLRGRNAPGFVDCPRVCERSNVVLFPFPGDDFVSVPLSSPARAFLRRP